mgnify:CR=1 FL=1
MLLVLCVDLDDDLGRKTGVETPVVGEEAVREAAVSLATTDAEDSDVNVLFEGLHIYGDATGPVEVAAVTGSEGDEVRANREVGRELDAVIDRLPEGEIRAMVVTDGAQDESVLPVIRSRVVIDGVRRVVVRQAQNLESMYYTIKQVLDDPETRGTILVPLGILLLVYPLALLADVVGVRGSAVVGLTSALLGLYALFRGLGLETALDGTVERLRNALYAGRVTILTYIVATALLVIGGVEAVDQLDTVREGGDPAATEVLAALVFGAVTWFAAAGLTSSLGQITDEYLAGRFRWRHLNAPFYILAIAAVLHAVSGYFLGRASLTYLAAMLTAGTLLGVISTLAFAVVESWRAPA